MEKKGLTADFDPSRLQVEICIFYGDMKLSQKQTQSIPLVKDIKSSMQETKTYEISVLNDKLLFEISKLEIDRDPNDLFAIIIVKYQSISNKISSSQSYVNI